VAQEQSQMSGLRNDQYLQRFWRNCPEEVVDRMGTQVILANVETQIPALQMRSCGRRATSLGTKTRRHLAAASSIALSDTSSASLAITSSLERRAGGQECCAPNAVLTVPLRCRFRGAQPHNAALGKFVWMNRQFVERSCRISSLQMLFLVR
jgi:hypothetical protein